MTTAHDVRFEPHEHPPHILAAGLGAQMVVLIVLLMRVGSSV